MEDLKSKARRDAERFCRRNKIYETYNGSVAILIEKLYITTYLRAYHQKNTEAKTIAKNSFETKPVKNIQKNFKTESFRVKTDIPNFYELQKVDKNAFNKSVEHKSWNELTAIDKAISYLVGWYMSNCAYSEKDAPEHAFIPIIRKTDNIFDRKINDRITYTEENNIIKVWAFDRERKLKEYSFPKEKVLKYIEEHPNG